MNAGTSPTLLVTGASGQLGRLVIERLLEADVGPIVAATRSPEKLEDRDGVEVRAADFDDPASMDLAFAGVARLLLISTDAVGQPGRRMEQHVRAIESAKRAGVQHIVYTSLSRVAADSPVVIAADHADTEAALHTSGLGYTILRNNLYTELLMMSLPAAITMGQLFAAAGDGGAAYVTREDCARAAAAALASDFVGQRTLEVTGPDVVSYGDLAAMASEIGGKMVSYIPLEPAQFAAGLVQNAGMPEPVATMMASFDEGMAKGLFGPATGVVEDLTGRPPESVASFVSRNKEALLAPPSQGGA